MTIGQSPTSASIQLGAQKAPDDPVQLGRWLTLQMSKIAAQIKLLAQGHIDQISVAPVKPRTGDIRIPDGTNWNPASGASPVWFNGISWIPFQANAKVVVNNNASATYIVPANTNYVGFTGTQVGTVAFTFPAAAAVIDGLRVTIYTQAAVGTSATFASTGAIFVGAPATLAAGSLTRFIYHHAGTEWLPL